MRKWTGWLLTLFLVSMLMTACAAKSEDALDYATSEERGYYESMPEEESVEAAPDVKSGIGESASMIERMVVYNADLDIAVESPEAAMEAVIDMAEEAGGFVVYSNISKTYTDSGAAVPRANITVRVPAGKLDSILAAIKNLTPNPADDVISENVSGEDVTAEYTDLTARLRNLESAEEALATLMEDAQDPEDVLAIFDELTYYRGEIEVVKGRMQYLEESVALSAITVNMRTKESLRPIEIAGWEPKGTVKRAVEALISSGQFIADAAIWFGIYCLPFLIPLGIGVYILIRILRKRRAKKIQSTHEVVTPTGQES